MGRRSPTNPRYGRDAKVGSTRRSASSLKPKRDAGESGPRPATKSKSDTKKRPTMAEVMPTSPEIKKWRTIWWVLFGVMVATALLQQFVPAFQQSREAMIIGLAVLTGAFVASLYIELGKIRVLRKELIEEQRKSLKKKGKL